MKLNEFRSVVKDSGNISVCNRITEIKVEDYLRDDFQNLKKPFPSRMVFSALSLVIIFTIGLFIRLSVNPVTTLTIDINPSIELELNAFNRVLAISGTNQDGLEFIENLDYKNKRIDNVILDIYNTGIEEAYFTESEAYMLIGVYGEDYDSEVNLGAILAEITEVNILSIFKHNITNSEFSLTVTQTTYEDVTNEGLDSMIGDITSIPSIDSPEYRDVIEEYGGIEYLIQEYQISEAKMVLIINVFNESEAYTTQSDLDYLVSLDISTLIDLFSELD